MTSIRKVSAIAGVSTATVSRALKNPEQVSPETREKVFKAVKEAKYRPNWHATAVSTGRSHSIVVLVPNLLNAFFQKVILGIEHAAQKEGYSVLLGDTQGAASRENEYASMVLTSRADGLIQLDHTFPFSETDAELADSVAMVSVGEKITGSITYPFIQLDNYSAGRALAHHFVSYGHKRFAVIVGQIESQIYIDRLSGFKSVLEEEGIPLDDDMIVGGEYTLEQGVAGVDQILAQDVLPTAIFCFNDDIAIGAVFELQRRGYKVPEDFSVAGFDNIRVSPFITPALTTIDQPAYEMGVKSVEKVISLIRGEKLVRSRELMPFNLIERSSSGPAKD